MLLFQRVDAVDLLSALRNVRDALGGDVSECDVRLLVDPHDGSWGLKSGDSSYDEWHSPYCGASSVAVHDGEDSLRATAVELVDQAMDAMAEAGLDVPERNEVEAMFAEEGGAS